jgi:hypothetical protein
MIWHVFVRLDKLQAVFLAINCHRRVLIVGDIQLTSHK